MKILVIVYWFKTSFKVLLTRVILATCRGCTKGAFYFYMFSNSNGVMKPGKAAPYFTIPLQLVLLFPFFSLSMYIYLYTFYVVFTFQSHERLPTNHLELYRLQHYDGDIETRYWVTFWYAVMLENQSRNFTLISKEDQEQLNPLKPGSLLRKKVQLWSL